MNADKTDMAEISQTASWKGPVVHKHQHKEFLSDRDVKRRDVIKRNNTVRTPIAFRGQVRAKSAGVIRASNGTVLPSGGKETSDTAVATSQDTRKSAAQNSSAKQRKSLHENLHDIRNTRSMESSSGVFRRQPLASSQDRVLSKPPVTPDSNLASKLLQPKDAVTSVNKSAPDDNPLSSKPKAKLSFMVRRSQSDKQRHDNASLMTPVPSIARSSSVAEHRAAPAKEEAARAVSTTPTLYRKAAVGRENSFTGHTYSYVGQSPLASRSERPFAARSSRSLSFKLAQSAMQVEKFSAEEANSNSSAPGRGTPPPVVVAKKPSLMDHVERSRIGASSGDSSAVLTNHVSGQKPAADAKSLRTNMSGIRSTPGNSSWCSSRGLPPALLTDMQLFRKLYMVQLEKEARKEVEQQYAAAKTKPASDSSAQSAAGVATQKELEVTDSPNTDNDQAAATNEPVKDEFVKITDASPRVSILKQTDSLQSRSTAPKSSSQTRKRVSFSSDFIPEIAI